MPTILAVDRFEGPTAGDARRYLPSGFELTCADGRDPDAQRALVGGADFLVVGGVHLRAPVIEAGARLKLIQKLGVGVDKIDLAAAARRGVPVGITPEANASSVGEATILLLLALHRRLLAADACVRAGRWDKSTIAAGSRDLAGRTVGIIGLGRTGRQVARRLAAFDVDAIYHDIVRPGADVEARLGVRYATLPELLAASDAVTLHVPWTEATHHLLDEEKLALMRPGALLVNTARGEVVDEAALTRALASGHLGGAGLDVFEREPVDGVRPLFAQPNVVLTPHVAGVTHDSTARMWQHAYANCRRVAAGETLPADHLITPPTGRAAEGS